MRTNREIVLALRAGESGAFEELYRSHSGRIWRFLARLAGEGPLAEDLFQETWLAAARHAHLLREDTAPLRWLYTIAHNKLRNARRFGAMEQRKRAALRGGAVGPEGRSEAGVVAHLDIERVSSALARMPETFREVLVLCACEGLDSRDAAAVLEISPEACRKRLSRAREALNSMLGPSPEGRGTPS